MNIQQTNLNAGKVNNIGTDDVHDYTRVEVYDRLYMFCRICGRMLHITEEGVIDMGLPKTIDE